MAYRHISPTNHRVGNTCMESGNTAELNRPKDSLSRLDIEQSLVIPCERQSHGLHDQKEEESS